MDDEDLTGTIMAGFIEEIPVQIEKLEQFIKNSDLQGVERQVHTIKGAAANVGGCALQEIALPVITGFLRQKPRLDTGTRPGITHFY